MDKNKNKIILDKPIVSDNNTLKCSFSCTGKIDAFFREKMLWVQYDKEIDKVPSSILVIPLLSNILPIAWASNTDIYLEEIDSNFLESAELIKKTLQAFYPGLNFNGTIYAKSKIINNGYSKQKRGALFSGGVDSITTYIRRKEEKPSLISIWGSDIANNNHKGWQMVKNNILNFSEQNNLTNLFLKTNFRSMLHYQQIEKGLSINWWGQIQHGYALLGLCAPISYSEGIKTIYIPSTHSNKSPDFPWGSHPLIDNNVKWGETSVVHDGYEITRQDKLGVISEYIKTINPLLQIRVCYKISSGENCSKCEKCSRTIIGLILEGVDPTQHGFTFNNETLDNIRTNILHHWKFDKNNITFWKDIIYNVPLKKANIPSEYDTFFAWLETVHFN